MFKKFCKKEKTMTTNIPPEGLRSLERDIGLNSRNGHFSIDMDIDEFVCTIRCNEWEVVLTHGQAGVIFEMLSHVYGIESVARFEKNLKKKVVE